MTLVSAGRSGQTFTALIGAGAPADSGREPALVETLPALSSRVRGEYREMPGLQLTVTQAARLFGVTPDAARAVLEHLCRASVLTCSDRDTYSLRR